ncbi:MAG: hypothetical protein KC466_18650, partial [Myxococcales bacterium]|nr:hypothetical protein [Myxococcales bacterium]
MTPSKTDHPVDLLRTLARALRDDALRSAVPDVEPFEVRARLLEAADLLDARAGARRSSPRAKPVEVEAEPREETGTLGENAIAYADGASKGNPGEAGAGALLLDFAGNGRVELREYLGRATNNVA